MSADSNTGRFSKKYTTNTNKNGNPLVTSNLRNKSTRLLTGNKVVAPKPVNLPSLRREQSGHVMNIAGSPDSVSSLTATSVHNDSSSPIPPVPNKWGSPGSSFSAITSQKQQSSSVADSTKETLSSSNSSSPVISNVAISSPTPKPVAPIPSAWAKPIVPSVKNNNYSNNEEKPVPTTKNTLSTSQDFPTTAEATYKTASPSNAITTTTTTTKKSPSPKLSPSLKAENSTSRKPFSSDIPMPFTNEANEPSSMSWDEMVSEEMDFSISVVEFADGTTVSMDKNNNEQEEEKEKEERDKEVLPSERFTDDYDRGYHSKRRQSELYHYESSSSSASPNHYNRNINGNRSNYRQSPYENVHPSNNSNSNNNNSNNYNNSNNNGGGSGGGYRNKWDNINDHNNNYSNGGNRRGSMHSHHSLTNGMNYQDRRSSTSSWNNNNNNNNNNERRSSHQSSYSSTSNTRRSREASKDLLSPSSSTVTNQTPRNGVYNLNDDRPPEIAAAQREAMLTAAELAKKRREADEAERQAAVERARQKALALAALTENKNDNKNSNKPQEKSNTENNNNSIDQSTSDQHTHDKENINKTSASPLEGEMNKNETKKEEKEKEKGDREEIPIEKTKEYAQVTSSQQYQEWHAQVKDVTPNKILKKPSQQQHNTNIPSISLLKHDHSHQHHSKYPSSKNSNNTNTNNDIPTADITEDEKSWEKYVNEIRVKEGLSTTSTSTTTTSTTTTTTTSDQWHSYAKRLHQHTEQKKNRPVGVSSSSSSSPTSMSSHKIKNNDRNPSSNATSWRRNDNDYHYSTISTEEEKADSLVSKKVEDLSQTDGDESNSNELQNNNYIGEKDDNNNNGNDTDGNINQETDESMTTGVSYIVSEKPIEVIIKPQRFVKPNSKLRHSQLPIIFPESIVPFVVNKPSTLQFMVDPEESDEDVLTFDYEKEYRNMKEKLKNKLDDDSTKETMEKVEPSVLLENATHYDNNSQTTTTNDLYPKGFIIPESPPVSITSMYNHHHYNNNNNNNNNNGKYVPLPKEMNHMIPNNPNYPVLMYPVQLPPSPAHSNVQVSLPPPQQQQIGVYLLTPGQPPFSSHPHHPQPHPQQQPFSPPHSYHHHHSNNNNSNNNYYQSNSYHKSGSYSDKRRYHNNNNSNNKSSTSSNYRYYQKHETDHISSWRRNSNGDNNTPNNTFYRNKQYNNNNTKNWS
ncbi:hypothetical protein BJ944DRAFT_250022 [Cunninghamella echinulata]|nr:hypothetical protein BJ944DRAFT_250022 [Cunninghamella echinulata]